MNRIELSSPSMHSWSIISQNKWNYYSFYSTTFVGMLWCLIIKQGIAFVNKYEICGNWNSCLCFYELSFLNQWNVLFWRTLCNEMLNHFLWRVCFSFKQQKKKKKYEVSNSCFCVIWLIWREFTWILKADPNTLNSVLRNPRAILHKKIKILIILMYWR